MTAAVIGGDATVMGQQRAVVWTRTDGARDWPTFATDARVEYRLAELVRPAHPRSAAARELDAEALERRVQSVMAAKVLLIGLISCAALAAGSWIGTLG
jgi:hypothetical protein